MKIDSSRWDELSPFLDEAFELEGEARTAFVERLSTERPDLVPDMRTLLEELQKLDSEKFLLNDPLARCARIAVARGPSAGELHARVSSGSRWHGLRVARAPE